MTNQIAVRLPPELMEELDGMVARGRFANRTEAIRTALEDLMARTREVELDEAIVAGYRAVPDDGEFDAVARANLREMIEEEPW